MIVRIVPCGGSISFRPNWTEAQRASGEPPSPLYLRVWMALSAPISRSESGTGFFFKFPISSCGDSRTCHLYETRIFFILIIRCWLSTENYYIWSFAAPVILITTVSTYQRLIPTVSWFRIYSTNIKSKQKNILSILAFIQPIYLRSYLRGSLSLYIASILSWKKPGATKLLDRGASAQTKIFRTDMMGMI